MAAVASTNRRGEILLLAGAILFVLLSAEIAIRVLAAGGKHTTGYAPVDTNRRAARPINTKGYRDLPRATPKPPGVRRILNLGDSFAWGASVEFEDAYPQRLERALTRRRHETWEVVNLALPGMATVDQAAQLEKEGDAYGPDAVLLGFVLNDSQDATAAEAQRAEDWLDHPPPSPGRSALVTLIRTRLWATAENRRRVSGYRSMYDDRAPGWVAARAGLKSMGAWCRQRGVPFVVAIFPLFANPLDDSYPFAEAHAKIAQAAAESGAKVVDLLPAYRGLRWDLLVVNGADDEHPNEIAHRIAAGVILRALDDVIPPAPAPATPPPSAVSPNPR
jgi:hypothetical protein